MQSRGRSGRFNRGRGRGSRAVSAGGSLRHEANEETCRPVPSPNTRGASTSKDSEEQTGGDLPQEAPAYARHFHELVKREEEEELRRCIQRWKQPVRKLVADGQCIPGLFASAVQWSNSMVLLRLPSKTSRLLPPAAVQNFSRGDTVRLQTHEKGDSGGSQQGGHESADLEDQLEICGTVCDISLTTVIVEVDEMYIREVGLQKFLQEAKTNDLVWRIDFGFSPITYIRMRDALETLAEKRSQALDFIINSHETSELNGETVLQPPDFPVGFSCLPSGLNASQLQARSTAIQSRISLIQGPPGTGKTQTCAAILCEMARRCGKGRVLACAYNNVAIDELSKRTKAVGGSGFVVVRLGEPSRSDPEAQCLALSSIEGKNKQAAKLKRQILDINDKIKEIRRTRDQRGRDANSAHRLYKTHVKASEKLSGKMTSLQKTKSHPDVTSVESQKLDKDLHATTAEKDKVDKAKDEAKQLKTKAFADERELDRKVGPLIGKLKELEKKLKIIRREIIASADVVCCTCIGAGSKDLKDFYFSALLIDECTQAMEPACLVPLLKLADDLGPKIKAAQLILAGDHKQLPPTVMTGQGSPLARSLFERMMAKAEHHHQGGNEPLGLPDSVPKPSLASKMLSIQYRMHSHISAFPSREFYGGQIQNGTKDEDRALPPLPMRAFVKQILGDLGTEWEKSRQHLMVINTDGLEGTQEVQAETSKENPGNAAIVRRISWALIEHEVVKSGACIGVITMYAMQRKLLASAGGAGGGSRRTKEANNMPDGVEVKTVDGFQGREKDIVILDTVRSNSSGQIGFLKDERRLNVAITRARRLLIIIGNASTLQESSSKPWMSLVAHAKEVGALVSPGQPCPPPEGETTSH